VFADPTGGFWKVKRLTLADDPAGFYLVHLCFGPSLEQLQDPLVLGPREFSAFLHDRRLRPHVAAPSAGSGAGAGTYSKTWTEGSSDNGPAAPGSA
jgi:hypothetical protein